ncbi:MAG: dTDP-4-dehydrorhamnose reductase family protein [Aridibacter sp.]
MKILIFGAGGMLGHKLVQILSQNFDVWATFHSDFDKYRKYPIFKSKRTFENVDVTNPASYFKIVRRLKPDVIINAVGIIKQLPDSKDVVKTLTVNSIFPHKLAEISEETDSRLITFSTDCVFDGKKGNYKETDVPNAYDLYGKSKNLGEVTDENCLTIRMSIIGRELTTKKSLIEWFLSNRGGKVEGFTSAIYTGFPTIILSEIIKDIISNHKNLHGLYHISSEPISKFDLLGFVREKYNIDVEIEPFSDFQIDRSLNSEKFRDETGFNPLSWEKMIEKMAEDSTLYEEN